MHVAWMKDMILVKINTFCMQIASHNWLWAKTANSLRNFINSCTHATIILLCRSGILLLSYVFLALTQNSLNLQAIINYFLVYLFDIPTVYQTLTGLLKRNCQNCKTDPVWIWSLLQMYSFCKWNDQIPHGVICV